MKNQLLDDIILINKDIDDSILRKRVLTMALLCFITALVIRFFTRGFWEVWVIDFIGITPLMQAIIMSSVFAYYIHHYGTKESTPVSFLFSLFKVFRVVAGSRTVIYLILGSLLFEYLDIKMDGDELQLFYLENFWLDILPLFTDTVVVFYFFNPLSKD